MDMLKIEAAAKVLAELTPEQREFALYLAARENPAPKRRGRPPGSSNSAKSIARDALQIMRGAEPLHCGCPADGNRHLPTCPTIFGDIARAGSPHPADVAERERGQ